MFIRSFVTNSILYLKKDGLYLFGLFAISVCIALWQYSKAETVYTSGIDYAVKAEGSTGGLQQILSAASVFGLGFGGSQAVDLNVEAYGASDRLMFPTLISQGSGGSTCLGQLLLTAYPEILSFDKTRCEGVTIDKVCTWNIEGLSQCEYAVLKALKVLVIGDAEQLGLVSHDLDKSNNIGEMIAITRSDTLSMTLVNTMYESLVSYYENEQELPQYNLIERLQMRADSLQNEVTTTMRRIETLTDTRQQLFRSREDLERGRLIRVAEAQQVAFMRLVETIEATKLKLETERPTFELLNGAYYLPEADRPSILAYIFYGLIISIILSMLYIGGRTLASMLV